MPPKKDKKDKETILKEQLKFWNKAEEGIPFNMGDKRYYPTTLYVHITTTSYPINKTPMEEKYPGGTSGKKSRRNKKRKSAKRKSVRRKSVRRKSVRRKSAKRKSAKRKSAKRKSVRRR